MEGRREPREKLDVLSVLGAPCLFAQLEPKEERESAFETIDSELYAPVHSKTYRSPDSRMSGGGSSCMNCPRISTLYREAQERAHGRESVSEDAHS